MKTIGGRFVVEDKIGEGGFGAVFRGRDTKLFNRRVAIKFLTKDDLEPDESVARFKTEAMLQAQLSSHGHANIVTIIEFVAEEETLAIVMEYVEGKTLDKILSEELLDNKQRIAVFRQVLSAVSYAHENNIIHRDIKPSNVIVQMRGGDVQAKVMDFGIAKLTTSSTGNTIFGGSPGYMSPEQLESRTTIDRRSDIFSLGILLYELLTGRRPFEGGSSETQQTLQRSPELTHLCSAKVIHLSLRRY